MAILIEERALSGRPNKVRKNLSFINPRISADRKMQQSKSVIIYAKDSVASDYRGLFKTNNDHIKANYYEIWNLHSPNTWELQKLYFQIKMRKDINDYMEIMSFHIDLDIANECYKKYPHIHVKHPKYECISNAHISLNLNDYLEVTNSIEVFDKNILKVLGMIEQEFIMKFAP